MVHSPLIDVPGGSSIVFSFIGYKTLTLSPDFSKNMTVIKGDSAAAIYGEKGKNSVVQVTVTKDGRAKQNVPRSVK